MMFKPIERHVIRWAPLEGEGLEHLHLTNEGNRIVARSVVIGSRGGTAYGAQYVVHCDQAWCIREFTVTLVDGRALHMTSNGEGRWQNADGEHDSRFDGCIDIDLAATPFTNSLPIRRANLGEGEAQEFCMLYVPFNTLAPVRDMQRYTCLRTNGLYRYEAVGRSFSANLPVDDHGLVIDYPTLFRRIS